MCVDTLFRQHGGHDTVGGDGQQQALLQVGAVALDSEGNVACATSTGGITGKRSGRVSYTPQQFGV